ncbi:MAG: adenylate/guanylate cyclase domain-containing protein [Paracoccaceae bacterium]|uniref:adenylate/guanylate cyclase domain-containing protein n=1 Tax=Candidatus Salinivivens marinus TaxID=3381703 RepID=UPI000BE0C2A7|nr:MAG: adenylate/guanylate cyclase domain-containing protein [Rhodobacteraceae bacterium MED-G08]
MINDEELKLLKKENSKLKLEARLRKSLSVELERQKGIVQAAKEEAEKQQQLLQKASDRLSKYLSPQICEQIFSDVEFDTGTGRKKLTIFFSDIVNFTSITESMEAEELSGFLNFYLTNMCEIALKYGGTIDKFIGDSVMIFFGDPQSKGPEQDALACCNMGLEMLAFVEKNEELFKEQFNFPEKLEIRIGVHSGVCSVGNFGSDQRLDYTVIGRAVNVAARLEQAAPKNSMLFSNSTKSLLADTFQVSDSIEVKAKGIDRPIIGYILTNQISKRSLVTVKEEGISLKFDPSIVDKKEVDKFLSKIKQ